MSGVYRGVCGRRCCYSPFVECIREGKCECHRPPKPSFELLAEQFKKQQEES